MTKTDIHKKAMLEALEKTLGIVSSAAKIAGIARTYHYEWIQKDEEYAKAVDEISNITLDFVESQLHKKIKDGSDTAIIFFLKTKGKKRGYIERQEVEMNGNLKHEGITVNIVRTNKDAGTNNDSI
jgi:hypothetical protein